MGKPKEKRFKVGADLVITPIDRFTISNRTDTGSMMIVAAKNIDPAAVSYTPLTLPTNREV